MLSKLHNKVTLALVGLSVLSALLVGIISHYKYKKTIINESYEKLQLLVESHGKDLEKQIDFIENYTLLLEAILKRTYSWEITESNKAFDNYANQIIPLLDSIAKKFKPLSYWIIFNPQYLKGGHTISFIDKKNTGNYVREPQYNVNDYDLNAKELSWWVDALSKGETWTNPYYWENWDIKLYTHAKAVDIDGKRIAVLGSDIDFDKFKHNIETRRIYQNGYFWLLNNDLEFILHPTLEGAKLNDVQDKQLVNQILKLLNSDRAGVTTYKYLNQNKVLAFYKLSNGWYLCSSIPSNEIFADLDETSRINLYIIILSVIIAVIISLLISRAISRPIAQLVKTIKKGTEGDFTVRAKIKSNDEFKTLANYFNYFMEKLEHTIQEIKVNESNLLKAKNKAEESDRLKSAFLANLSHEIRTPMNAILGFTSLLSYEDIDKKTRAEYINYIQSNTNDLLYILMNLIDFSLIEVKQLPLKNHPFSINKLLQSVYETCQNDLINNDKDFIELLLEYDMTNKTEELIIGDVVKITQVFTNLLHNSMKFTEKGFIKIGCKLKNNSVVFYVEDTGIGLAEKEQSIVFERFFKGENTHSSPQRGIGLGLTISKKLVEIMKGNIWIESFLGKGTTVFFSIPYTAADDFN